MTEHVVEILRGCARCHTDHGPVTFRPLTHPIELPEAAPLTHWAPCEVNGEPIVMRFTSSDEGWPEPAPLPEDYWETAE